MVNPEPMPVDELVDALKLATHEIGKHLEPDGDWQPVAFCVSRSLGLVPVMPEQLSDERDKELFCAAVATAIAISRAHACVLVLPAYVVVPGDAAGRAIGDQWKAFEAEHGREPDITELGIPRPTDHPDRVEALVLNVYERERGRMEYAEVIRGGPFPVLGEWQGLAHDDEGEETLGGRFSDAVQGALKQVAGAASAEDN